MTPVTEIQDAVIARAVALVALASMAAALLVVLGALAWAWNKVRRLDGAR